MTTKVPSTFKQNLLSQLTKSGSIPSTVLDSQSKTVVDKLYRAYFQPKVVLIDICDVLATACVSHKVAAPKHVEGYTGARKEKRDIPSDAQAMEMTSLNFVKGKSTGQNIRSESSKQSSGNEIADTDSYYNSDMKQFFDDLSRDLSMLEAGQPYETSPLVTQSPNIAALPYIKDEENEEISELEQLCMESNIEIDDFYDSYTHGNSDKANSAGALYNDLMVEESIDVNTKQHKTWHQPVSDYNDHHVCHMDTVVGSRVSDRQQESHIKLSRSCVRLPERKRKSLYQISLWRLLSQSYRVKRRMLKYRSTKKRKQSNCNSPLHTKHNFVFQTLPKTKSQKFENSKNKIRQKNSKGAIKNCLRKNKLHTFSSKKTGRVRIKRTSEREGIKCEQALSGVTPHRGAKNTPQTAENVLSAENTPCVAENILCVAENDPKDSSTLQLAENTPCASNPLQATEATAEMQIQTRFSKPTDSCTGHRRLITRLSNGKDCERPQTSPGSDVSTTESSSRLRMEFMNHNWLLMKYKMEPEEQREDTTGGGREQTGKPRAKLNKRSTHTVSGNAKQMVGKGEATVSDKQAMDASQPVTGASQQVTRASQQVTGASQQVTGASQQLTSASQQVTGASQQVTGASQQVTGAPQQMTGATQQMTGAAYGVICTVASWSSVSHVSGEHKEPVRHFTERSVLYDSAPPPVAVALVTDATNRRTLFRPIAPKTDKRDVTIPGSALLATSNYDTKEKAAILHISTSLTMCNKTPKVSSRAHLSTANEAASACNTASNCCSSSTHKLTSTVCQRSNSPVAFNPTETYCLAPTCIPVSVSMCNSATVKTSTCVPVSVSMCNLASVTTSTCTPASISMCNLATGTTVHPSSKTCNSVPVAALEPLTTTCSTVAKYNQVATVLNIVTTTLSLVTKTISPVTTRVNAAIAPVSQVTTAVNPATTAVNQATTAVNPATTAVNPATTAVNPSTTAVNPATTAVNQATTAVNPATTAVNSATTAVNPVTTAFNHTSTASRPVLLVTPVNRPKPLKSSSPYDVTSLSKPNQIQSNAISFSIEKANVLNNSEKTPSEFYQEPFSKPPIKTLKSTGHRFQFNGARCVKHTDTICSEAVRCVDSQCIDISHTSHIKESRNSGTPHGDKFPLPNLRENKHKSMFDIGDHTCSKTSPLHSKTENKPMTIVILDDDDENDMKKSNHCISENETRNVSEINNLRTEYNKIKEMVRQLDNMEQFYRQEELLLRQKKVETSQRMQQLKSRCQKLIKSSFKLEEKEISQTHANTIEIQERNHSEDKSNESIKIRSNTEKCENSEAHKKVNRAQFLISCNPPTAHQLNPINYTALSDVRCVFSNEMSRSKSNASYVDNSGGTVPVDELLSKEHRNNTTEKENNVSLSPINLATKRTNNPANNNENGEQSPSKDIDIKCGQQAESACREPLNLASWNKIDCNRVNVSCDTPKIETLSVKSDGEATAGLLSEDEIYYPDKIEVQLNDHKLISNIPLKKRKLNYDLDKASISLEMPASLSLTEKAGSEMDKLCLKEAHCKENQAATTHVTQGTNAAAHVIQVTTAVQTRDNEQLNSACKGHSQAINTRQPHHCSDIKTSHKTIRFNVNSSTVAMESETTVQNTNISASSSQMMPIVETTSGVCMQRNGKKDLKEQEAIIKADTNPGLSPERKDIQKLDTIKRQLAGQSRESLVLCNGSEVRKTTTVDSTSSTSNQSDLSMLTFTAGSRSSHNRCINTTHTTYPSHSLKATPYTPPGQPMQHPNPVALVSPTVLQNNAYPDPYRHRYPYPISDTQVQYQHQRIPIADNPYVFAPQKSQTTLMPNPYRQRIPYPQSPQEVFHLNRMAAQRRMAPQFPFHNISRSNMMRFQQHVQPMRSSGFVNGLANANPSFGIHDMQCPRPGVTQYLGPGEPAIQNNRKLSAFRPVQQQNNQLSPIRQEQYDDSGVSTMRQENAVKDMTWPFNYKHGDVPSPTNHTFRREHVLKVTARSNQMDNIESIQGPHKPCNHLCNEQYQSLGAFSKSDPYSQIYRENSLHSFPHNNKQLPVYTNNDSLPNTCRGPCYASVPAQFPSARLTNLFCGNSFCKGPAEFLCSGCRKIAYCSTKCQRLSWKEHILSCKR